jgi:hypothetical protein
MYSYLDIKLIWENCKTVEDWQKCVDIFSDLTDDNDFLKTFKKNKAYYFQIKGLKQLEIIENGNAGRN